LFRKRIQLGLIHAALAMTLVPINSTLNRVMIKELALSATLVALLASLPYLFSPIQVAIGSFSDRHPLLGYRRTPYILLGLILCVLGVVISPLAAFLMSESFWAGLGLGILAFGAWGMGFNFSTVSYLSLASELSGEKGRGKTIAVMWFMMISGIILTAIVLSLLVNPYSPEALERGFWIVGLAALGIGLVGIVKLEVSARKIDSQTSGELSWAMMARAIYDNKQAKHFFWYLVILLAAILGQDILLEPFGGEAFGMSVNETTRITSIWGGCVLAALAAAGFLENRVNKRTVAKIGAWSVLVGFILITLSGMWLSQVFFYSGVVFLGLGTGLATVSNLSLMLDMTTASNVGLFIGAWGMANALSRLIGSVLGGAVRDLVTQISLNPISGYVVVFIIEASLILVSLFMLRSINVRVFQEEAEDLPLVERAAISSET
jgi:BCD family chlorophyll transporter-like MFS transporter